MFNILEATPLVDSDGNDPTSGEKTHNKVAKGAKVAVESRDSLPELPFEVKVPHKQSEGFDAADHERDDD